MSVTKTVLALESTAGSSSGDEKIQNTREKRFESTENENFQKLRNKRFFLDERCYIFFSFIEPFIDELLEDQRRCDVTLLRYWFKNLFFSKKLLFTSLQLQARGMTSLWRYFLAVMRQYIGAWRHHCMRARACVSYLFAVAVVNFVSRNENVSDNSFQVLSRTKICFKLSDIGFNFSWLAQLSFHHSTTRARAQTKAASAVV